ncbi:hypothetical protein MSTO_44640 [Mycobacterium stomatepiae]|uniref:Uncharacterized protein n=2 Tax=Mycobacterium stomatepiae TaxID=470076 RepID=A0A7I7QDC1_9MYCO|nr:hypothetical protein MSTO_44640 [Mycobacterium stomatepiae]
MAKYIAKIPRSQTFVPPPNNISTRFRGNASVVLYVSNMGNREGTGCSQSHHTDTEPLMTHNTLWIVIALVATLVLIAAVIVAVSATRRRRHRQAEQIREHARLESAKVERREALAQETAAKARAAQAEAEVKAAEAARLAEHAAEHQSEAAASREQLRERWDHADRIDPRTGKKGRDDEAPAEDSDKARSAESLDAATDVEAVRQETYRGTRG